MGLSPSTQPPVEAIVALGGNLGDVLYSFTGARCMLGEQAGIELTASSLVYRSPPMGPQDQPYYLNAVIAVNTTLEPAALLACMQAVEQAFGRKREGLRWSERTLDLDLIAHNDTCMQSETLTLPHPGMQHRMFVLQPLCDIRPDWRHPRNGQSARELMQALHDMGERLLTGGKPW